MLINFVQVERVTWWTSSSHSCPWNAGTLSSVLRRRWKPGASNQTMLGPGNWQIKSWTTFLGLRESSLSRVARRLPAGWDSSCKQPRDGINTCGSISVGGSNYRHQTNSISQSAQHIWRHHMFDCMKHTGKVYIYGCGRLEVVMAKRGFMNQWGFPAQRFTKRFITRSLIESFSLVTPAVQYVYDRLNMYDRLN